MWLNCLLEGFTVTARLDFQTGTIVWILLGELHVLILPFAFRHYLCSAGCSGTVYCCSRNQTTPIASLMFSCRPLIVPWIHWTGSLRVHQATLNLSICSAHNPGTSCLCSAGDVAMASSGLVHYVLHMTHTLR